MRPAALPARARERGRQRRAQPRVRIRDRELHAGEAAGDQAAQEGEPARPVLAGHDIEAEHFALAVRVHAHGD